MAGDVKLSKAQVNALAVLDKWRAGMQIATTNLRRDGVSLATLRSLEEFGFVDSERAINGIFWRLTSSGRAALTRSQP